MKPVRVIKSTELFVLLKPMVLQKIQTLLLFKNFINSITFLFKMAQLMLVVDRLALKLQLLVIVLKEHYLA